MLQVPGYSITSKVNEGSSTIIFRAIATETGQSAILKIPKGEYPTPRELATLRQEYLLLRSIDIIGVVKTFGLERYGNGLALILEDLRGQTLAAVERGQQLSIEQKLQISIQIVEILKSIHRVGIIHRDLKPHKITPVEKWQSFFRRPSEKAAEVFVTHWLWSKHPKRRSKQDHQTWISG